MAITQQGRVVAVSMSPTGGVPKHPQGHVVIGPQGVEGDFHAGPINRHKKSGDPEPNWRQVTLVAQDVLDELNARLGVGLKAGDLGENILVAGLGDLSQLKKGDRLQVGAEAVLEVTAQNRPCDTIRVYHPTLPEEITGRRGIAAVVVRPGTVRPGDACLISGSSPESQ
ncbi:MAG: MOSC domain-containing protein [Chloroflexi bacterium]|nr:MOSC domain-containing protein [Chloroflexota bacterium]